LLPTYAGYLWVLSCQFLIYSCLKKNYLFYQDQDHIQKDVILGVSLNKNKGEKLLHSHATGLIHISRYHISNISKKQQYKWTLIISAKDQFRVKTSLLSDVTKHSVYAKSGIQSNKNKDNISLFSLDKESFLKNKKSQIKSNRITNFNHVFFFNKKIHRNSIKAEVSNILSFHKGLLGRSYKTFKSTYIFIVFFNKILIESIDSRLNPELFKEQIYLKLNFTIFFILCEIQIHKFFFSKKRCQLRLTSNYQSLLKNSLEESNLGNFFSQEIIFKNSKFMSDSGRIVSINKHYSSLQLAKPYLTMPKAKIYVYNKEPIPEGKTLLSLIYERLRTSDITQGLPKAEQLLEARPNNEVSISLIRYFEDWTKRIKKYFFLPYSVFTPKLVQHSQIDLVNRIQAVYLAQGVYTSDKHIEVIVRQMTSKVLVVDHFDPTAVSPEGVIRWSLNSKKSKMCLYLPGELIGLKQAQRVHRALQEPIPYKPLLLGVTKASLNTDSFISEASFERTANVLSKSAFKGRIDWMKGLKENIIFGGVIPAGTGFPEPYWEIIFKDVPKLKNNTQKSLFAEISKPKICYRSKFPLLAKGKLHNHLRQSMYNKYNYQKYSVLSEHTRKDLPVKMPFNLL